MSNNYLTDKYVDFFRFVESLHEDNIPPLMQVAKIVPPHFLSKILFTENIQVLDVSAAVQEKLETTDEALILEEVVRKLNKSFRHRDLPMNPDRTLLAGQLVLTLAKYCSNPKNMELIISQQKNASRRERIEPEEPLDPSRPPMMDLYQSRSREELLRSLKLEGIIFSPRDLALIFRLADVGSDNVLPVSMLKELESCCELVCSDLDGSYMKKILGLDELTGHKQTDQRTMANLKIIAQEYLDSLEL